MPLIVYLLAGKILALLVGGYYFKFLSRSYKIVFFLIAIASFCEGYGYYFSLHLEPNAWIFNLFMPIDFWLTGISGIILIKNSSITKLFIFLLSVNTIIWVINIRFNTIYNFQTGLWLVDVF